MKAMSTVKKRTRVTRQIRNHLIPQYYLEQQDSVFSEVKCSTVSETIESYLDSAKLLTQSSSTFIDEYIATAVEYDGSVKVLHFDTSMKKHSCKQKRLKFQTAWWSRPRDPFEKPRSGAYPKAEEPVFSIDKDALLFDKHCLVRFNQKSHFRKVIDQIKCRLNRRRQTDDVILDTAYFVREFFLTKPSISFRIFRSSDLPDCFVPPSLKCGYFPHCAVENDEKKDYLMARYQEAQMEYLSLNYRDIKPPEGFEIGEIEKDELWDYHCSGRHIHGFYLVWIDIKKRGVENRRYLVDMFNFLLFPLDIKYERWENRLKYAFDQTTMYNLHLSEIIRVNRPVFDALARNPALFQNISLKEITQLMTEQGLNPKYYLYSVGAYEFYEWGRSSTNADYLSAFMIICGGSKVATKPEYFDYGKTRIYNRDYTEVGVLSQDGRVYTMETSQPLKEIQVHSHNYEHKIEHLFIRHGLTKEECKLTRIISDAPKEQELVSKPRSRKQQRNGFKTRKELMETRNRSEKLSNSVPTDQQQEKKNPEKPAKKKPGRKAETIQEKGLKKHDFSITYIASDFESDFEGYISDTDEFVEERPRLKRSISSESVFLDVGYKEHIFQTISCFHQKKIHEVPQCSKKKLRKMKRTRQKHSLRYRMLLQESEMFKEMLECYHGNLPRTALEIARTKTAIRIPSKFEKFNLPQVYVKGEASLIDESANLLKEIVAHVVAKEHANVRAGNNLSRTIQKARTDRRDRLDNPEVRPPKNSPTHEYLSMEMLTLERMSGRASIDDAKKQILAAIEDHVEPYLQLSWTEKWRRMMKASEIWLDMQHEKNLHYSFNRQRQLDRSLRTIKIGTRSLQAQDQREFQRRLARRAHSEKVAARKRLEKASQRLKNGFKKPQKPEKEEKEVNRGRKRKNPVGLEVDQNPTKRSKKDNETESLREEVEMMEEDRIEAVNRTIQQINEERRMNENAPLQRLEYEHRHSEAVLDGAEINLLQISKDLRNPQFRAAIDEFRMINSWDMFFENAADFAQILSQHPDFEVQFNGYLPLLIDEKQDISNVSENLDNLLENIAEGFKCVVIPPEGRHWIFRYNKDALLTGISDKLRSFINRTEQEKTSSASTASNVEIQPFESEDNVEDEDEEESESESLESYQLEDEENSEDSEEEIENDFEENDADEFENQKACSVENAGNSEFGDEEDSESPEPRKNEENENINKEENDHPESRSVENEEALRDGDVEESAHINQRLNENGDDVEERESENHESRPDEDEEEIEVLETPTIETKDTFRDGDEVKSPIETQSVENETSITLYDFLKQKEQLKKSLEILECTIKSNFKESHLWIFPFLGAFSILLTGKQSDDQSKRALIDGEDVQFDEESENLNLVKEKLNMIAGYFHEGNKKPEKLREMIRKDGYFEILELVEEAVTAFTEMVLGLKLDDYFEKNATSEDVICELLEAVAVECGDWINEKCNVKPSKCNKLREDQKIVASLILNSSFVHPKTDLETEQRNKTVSMWHEAIEKLHNNKLAEIRNTSLQRIQQKLSLLNSEEASTSGTEQ